MRFALLLGLFSHRSDNTPDGNLDFLSRYFSSAVDKQRLRIVCFGKNEGIARALNVGAMYARDSGAEYVLFSDQDSMPKEGMVDGLLRSTNELRELGYEVGAVGPSFINTVSEVSYRFQVKRPGQWTYSNAEPTRSDPYLETLSLITSGMLVPVSVLAEVGMMREDFFIDHVDIEWCHRARCMGYHLFGTWHAQMDHQMGEGRLRVWVLGWRSVNGYGPLRLYYQFRNFTYMMRLDYIPWWWKLRASRYWLGEAYAHLFFSRQRVLSLRMIMLGVFDGIRGCMGKCSWNV